MKDDNLITALEEKVRALGFNFFGVIPAQPARRLAAYLEWIEQGYHGQMGYMARPDRISRRQDLEGYFTGCTEHSLRGPELFSG
ncbi:MAG: hypothetical protein M5U34_23920 [Chloroflexi bacterium]|nr:hypothetical protein [Chloroflexota bacterium]